MSWNVRNLVVLGATTALLGGCSADSPALIQRLAVSDSAGIEFVTSPGALASAHAPIAFSEQPIVQLTGPFHEVASVQVFSDRIVVADEFDNEIRAYDLEGVVQSRSGGRGDGPTEFPRAPHLLRDQSDGTFLAYDGAAKKALNYDASSGSLEFVSSFPDVHREVGARGPVAASGDQLIFVSLDVDERAIMSGDDGPMVMPERIASVDVHTGGMEILAEYDSPLFYRHDGALGMIPFAPRPVAAATQHGALVLSPGLAEFREYDWSGTLRRTIRVDTRREPVTAGSLAEYTRYRDSVGGASDVAPDSIPFFDALLVDAEDRIWARRYSIDLSQPSRWVVFGGDGAAIGTIEVPAGLDLMSVGFGLAAGVVLNELDEQAVVVFGLSEAR